MSILKYFKRAPVIQDEELPEPSSCLSNTVPLKAIEMANAKVVKVKNKPPRGTRVSTIFILTPTQRYKMGKRAAEHSTAALCYFTKKYPELPLKETGVQRFKTGINLTVSSKEPLMLLCQLKFKSCHCKPLTL